jgi:hypothetical protein
MSREDRREELGEKTQQLLQGSLKHVRAAALAVALVPLASVAVSRTVAQAQCGFSAAPPCPPGVPSVPFPCDFITGGGFVFTDSGPQANFGSHGGCKNGAFWGHINYVDHGGSAGAMPYHVDSTQITGYLEDTAFPNAREICGFARTNAGETVLFRVRMEDNGEPGINDTFGIRLSNGYDLPPRPLGNGGPGGGNIQLHKPNPSTTGPNPPPDEATMCGGLLTP